MKYYTRLKLYKASAVKFDPIRIEASSYDWWIFVAVIKGKIVFNDYTYSPTTTRHQSKVRALMRELNIVPDVIIKSSKSLYDDDFIDAAIKDYQYEINELVKAIDKPRSQYRKNEERTRDIRALEIKIKEVSELK